MIVYRLISPSGKSYIGLTTRELSVRWGEHVSAWLAAKKRGGRKNKLQCAMDKYEPREWRQEILFETEDSEVLATMEVFNIIKYDTVNNGYNINPGGDLGSYGREYDDEHREALALSKKAWWDSPRADGFRQALQKRMSSDNPSKPGNIPFNKGLKHRPETIQKIAEGSKKSWDEASEERRARAGQRAFAMGKANKGHKRHAKTWLVTDPLGNKFEVQDLPTFVREKNLKYTTLVAGFQSNGYRAKKKGPEGP